MCRRQILRTIEGLIIFKAIFNVIEMQMLHALAQPSQSRTHTLSLSNRAQLSLCASYSKHRSPKDNVSLRVCMEFKFDRKLNNSIPSYTPGVFCCVFMASQSFRKPFLAVYLSVAGPRAALYYVNEKVGNLKLTRHLKKALRKPC